MEENQAVSSESNDSYVCSECGADVTIDEKICPKCGADVSEVEAEEIESSSTNQGLFSFTGRIGRGTFWGVWFSMMAVSLVFRLVIDGISSSGDEAVGVVVILSFLFLIPYVWIGLAMQVKRWHDRDKSGWMVLINFIPIIGWLWALTELGFLQGTIGPNQYGEDPLQSIEKKSEAVVI